MLALDAVLFEQVLFNLLDNAAKYAAGPCRHPHSELARQRDLSACRSWTRADGIPPADLERIFDKFYRAQEEADQVRAGTGLRACDLARGFVEAMRGTITAANRTDRTGAVFTIRAADPGRAEGETGHRRMSAHRSRSWWSTTSRRSASCCASGLSTQGYEVLEAPNGKAALELLAQEARSRHSRSRACRTSRGSSCCRRSRDAATSGLPIVVLSSRGDEAGKVAALDLGADDYVTKPFGMEELLARMRAALRHQLQVQRRAPGVPARRPLRVDSGAPHRQDRRTRR